MSVTAPQQGLYPGYLGGHFPESRLKIALKKINKKKDLLHKCLRGSEQRDGETIGK